MLFPKMPEADFSTSSDQIERKKNNLTQHCAVVKRFVSISLPIFCELWECQIILFDRVDGSLFVHFIWSAYNKSQSWSSPRFCLICSSFHFFFFTNTNPLHITNMKRAYLMYCALTLLSGTAVATSWPLWLMMMKKPESTSLYFATWTFEQHQLLKASSFDSCLERFANFFLPQLH